MSFGKEVNEMIKKIIGLSLSFVMLCCATGTYASAANDAASRQSEIVFTIDPPAEETDAPPTHAPTDTPAPTATPTAAPTATPTVAPTATPTAKPTATPTAKPTAVPTQAPTAAPVITPRPTSVSTTQSPYVTTAPVITPTQQPSYIAYTLWDYAADTIQKVVRDTPFEIVLVEGVSDYLTFSNFYGNIPDTVEFINSIETDGLCMLKGMVNANSSYELGLEFTLKGGQKLMLNFSISAVDEIAVEPTLSPYAFPEAHKLIPFGGNPSAMTALPHRKEDA